MAGSLVSIIGPPAVGKTTTAHWLAEALDARLILEDYEGNPFLSESYLGHRELALPAQLYFLFSRVSQLSRDSWPAGGVSVSDYGFCQDAIYAQTNLSPDDVETYRRLSVPAGEVVKSPDVIIHLDGDEGLLLERISRRGRGYESTFSAEFLATMRAAYRDVSSSTECAVLTADVGEVDLLGEPGRGELLGRVREALS